MHTKRFMLTILLILIAVVASAQITVTAETIPGIGFTYNRYASPMDIAVDNGGSGPNHVWNITNTLWPDTTEMSKVSPSSTPFAVNYPNATVAISWRYQGTVSDYDYLRVTADGYYSLGYASLGFDPVVYDSPEWSYPIPLTYPQIAWTSVARTTTVLPHSTTVQVDTTFHTIDGWGTITTQFGSAQVLRIFNRHSFNDISGSQITFTYQDVSYSWLNNRGLEVVRIASPVDTTNPNFTVGSIVIVGIEDEPADPIRGPVARDFSVGQNYPNPFNPTTTLPIDLEKSSHVSMDIYDETGRLVSHTEHDLTAGTHEVAVDGSAWASGSYFARVSAQDQSQTVKMLMVK